jgi:hypothetical protein
MAKKSMLRIATVDEKSKKKLPKPNESSFSGCPWCGEKPEVTKHPQEPLHHLEHHCKRVGLIDLGWSLSIERLAERWNRRHSSAE